MKKRFLALIMALTMVLTLLPVSALARPLDSGVTGDGFKWDITESVLTISGSGAMADYGTTTCPWRQYTNGIREVVISEGVTYIGERAFDGLYWLEKVTLPSSLKSIGSSAFQRCERLPGINLPNGLGSIGDYAFSRSAIESITIPDNVKHIGELAFYSCMQLKSLSIPAGLTDIGDSAFSDCVGLADKNGLIIVNNIVFGCSEDLPDFPVIPEGVTRIAAQAFSQSRMEGITLPQSLTVIGDSAFQMCESLKSVKVPDGVSVIGYNTFASCSSLEDVTLPTGLKELGDRAFMSCSSLKEITIPEGTKSIGMDAFMHCSSLTSISFPESLERIGDGAFINCDALEKIEYGKNLKSFGSGVFRSCAKLCDEDGFQIINGVLLQYRGEDKTVTVPDGVTFVAGEAFYNCDTLDLVVLPEGVTELGDKAFGYCNIDYVSLPESLLKIGANAFINSTTTRIVIPAGVREIGYCAFSSTGGMLYIQFNGAPPEKLGYNPETGEYEPTTVFCDTTIVVPGDPYLWKKSPAYDGEYETWYNIPIHFGDSGIVDAGNDSWGMSWILDIDGILEFTAGTRIPDYTANEPAPWSRNIDMVHCVILRDGTNNIGMRAFADCRNLTEIHVPFGLNTISFGAFSGCSSLRSVYYYGTEESLAEMNIAEGNEAFENAELYIVKPVPVPIDIEDLIPAFQESILWAVANGITTGYDDGTFRPNATCTRGHVVTFLWRAAGSPEPQSLENPFSDVSESSPFFKAILWAAEQGITTGYADGTFRPNAACTRAHVVTFLWRVEGRHFVEAQNSFTDLDGLNTDFRAAIHWAASAGITTGYDDGTFRPNAVCTRAHVVTFLYRDIEG